MALQARRFHGKPLLQPNYNFCDAPHCGQDLAGSTLSIITERQHLVDSIAELTLVCNEAVRRQKPGASSSSTIKSTKPLSIEYIFDRIDTDDPIWALMIRTDTPMSLKGRPSNMKASPLWKRGMLQGFITMTTFTNWQSSFRFDSIAECAFGNDGDELQELRKKGICKYDEDGSLAEELEASVKAGNPHVEGIVYPRIAEVSLLGGLGCGKQLLKLLVEHIERQKPSSRFNYDYIVLQATENSISFYESMGFIRVGCVQGRAPSPNEYVCSQVEDYYTTKNGETPASVAKDFCVDVWDIVFLNKPVWPDLLQKSWLKMGTKISVPKKLTTDGLLPKWYISQKNETPRSIAKKFRIDFSGLLRANQTRYPDMVGNSKLIERTQVQISRFDMDESNSVAYSHWTFPDADLDDDDGSSYMMALKLDRIKGPEAKVKPLADSLAVPIKPYSPEATGAKALLLQSNGINIPLAQVFSAKKHSFKEPKKPKRPIGSYAHFTSECRRRMGELEGKLLGEVSQILSEKWRAMSDEDKIPYQERSKESKAAYTQALAQYQAEMEHFQHESPEEDANLVGQVDTSLLEKVIKLKSTDGVSGASKFEYYYVLTFIPDLAWVHLIPMRKVGVFGPDYPDACGRPLWMIVGEDKGKAIDTTAAVCQPVTALTMQNSADADDEQWDIYDNGEKPPHRPTFDDEEKPKAKMNISVAPANMAFIGNKPKKPASSFAFFLGDAMRKRPTSRKISERTKTISERWSVMTEKEKQKYEDKHTNAREKYLMALNTYNEDLAKLHCERPGIHTTSKPVKKHAPGKSVVGGGYKKNKLGQPTPGATNETPKREKVQPQKDPSHASISKAVMHTVNKDPADLEKLLGKLEGDSHTCETPGKDDIILSLMDDSYKEIIWKHFNLLGRTRHSKREKETCDEVLKVLKQKTGNTGKIFKGSHGKYHQVTDVVARAKIITDIRRRVHTAQTWLKGEKNQRSVTSRKSPPFPKCPVRAKNPKTKRLEFGANDVVLSLLNEKYKNIMWSHFRKLGRAHGEEEELGRTIFQTLKKGLGRGGVFFKKPSHSNTLLQINDAAALQKVTQDLKRRMKSSDKWLLTEREEAPLFAEKNSRLSTTRKAQHSCQHRTSNAVSGTKPPQLSTSCYPRRGSQLEPAVSVRAKPQRPLAPISSKSYGKKKTRSASRECPPAAGDKNEEAPRRYPERKRKQNTDDSHVVSDDAATSSDVSELKKKRIKTK